MVDKSAGLPIWTHDVRPQGERQGWRESQNRLERFWTHDVRPKGERQGWRESKRSLGKT